MNNNGLWLNKNGKKICYNPWTHFEVNTPTGDVTMCCDNNTILGNVNDNTIEEIWNGKKFQVIRKKMFEFGGEKLCGKNCLLLNGMKNFQNFAWHKNIDKKSLCFSNAVLNEDEILKGIFFLKSKPRWMRFALSYKCNYACYHCYQKNDRDDFSKLPKKFIDEVKSSADFFQFLFIYGGEPTFFSEFEDLLALGKKFPNIRYGMATNGSLIHKHIEKIKNVNWASISVSLDASKKTTYEKLRKSKLWLKVIENIRDISSLKERNENFDFTINMTLNSKNFDEIEDFTNLAKKLNAIPKISLVSNPYGTFRFQRDYLFFTKKQQKEILRQIEKVSLDDPIIFNRSGLNVLKNQIQNYSKVQRKILFSIAIRKFLSPKIIDFLKKSISY